MTLSARTSTLGGIVRPICLAAFRLTMNSNFIGCSTGKVGRLGAFQKCLSTYVAARRSKIGKRLYRVPVARYVKFYDDSEEDEHFHRAC